MQLRHWESQCENFCAFAQCMTCNLFGGAGTRTDSMNLVAEVMAQFFYGDPDLVVSDIVAGFVLLSAVHLHDRDANHSIRIAHNVDDEIVVTSDPPPSTVDTTHTTLDNVVDDMAYFSKYAIGIYGWMLYVWSRPWKGMLQLLFSRFQRSMPNIVGDNCLKLHQTAFQLQTQTRQEDIVYATFSNNVCQPAFAIILDHEKQTVIIVIRGTLSLEDCLTDVIAHNCSLSEAAEEFEFDGHEGYAHHGMLHAALWLRREIEQLGVLDVIYTNAKPLPLFQQLNLASYSNYTLTTCGHSLGAGTATLLTMMLRSKYPGARCYAFSPPGCVLSEAHAKDTEAFVTTCIIGDDFVARSSMLSILNLRNKVLEMIERSKVSKRDILHHMISRKHPSELLLDPDQEVVSNFGKHLRHYRQMLLDRQNREDIIPMFIPGRIIHFVREHSELDRMCCLLCRGPGACCTKRSDYHARWASAGQFTHVNIAHTMLDDHFPDKMHHILGDVSKQFHGHRN